MRENHVRPTLLAPLWHAAGFALGAATALMGEKAAFACTVAVESVIDAHYAAQEAELAGDDRQAALATTISTFRAEEKEHHDASLAQGAEDAPLFPVLSSCIKLASQTAIWLSTRL